MHVIKTVSSKEEATCEHHPEIPLSSMVTLVLWSYSVVILFVYLLYIHVFVPQSHSRPVGFAKALLPLWTKIKKMISL